jgi:diacylglycerol O-acyltransferase-1
MATITEMASSSAIDLSAGSHSTPAPVNRGKEATAPTTNGSTTPNTTRLARDTKYRHVFATHSLTRTSCLSHDADKSPSFVGFRNLMILVLIVSNLRLMIVNLQKVHPSVVSLPSPY